TYDAAGRVTRVSDMDGVATRLDYDAIGRIVAAGPTTGGRWFERRFDSQGRLATSRDARGVVANLQYDFEDRVTARRCSGPGIPAGQAVETFAYDPFGQLIAAANGVHAFEASFDSIGRCVYEGVDGQRTNYQYSADLSTVTIRSSGGASFQCEHD